MKKAFTLVEMIVVVGIIGILMAIMLVSFSGNSDSANAAKCLSNMHHLALACQAYGMENAYWPMAGSLDKYSTDYLRDKSRHVVAAQGWIGWSTAGSGGSYVSPYSDDDMARRYCITNGVLWRYVNGDAGLYTCPAHLKAVKEAKVRNLSWSYVMNASFHWNARGGKPYAATHRGPYYTTLTRTDRRLLFAELPFLSVSSLGAQKNVSFSSGASTANDPILQYQNCEGSGQEIIGFNHKVGKRETYAHVCFADGHTEKLRLPRSPSENNLRDLTMWLCYPTDTGKANGKAIDVVYNGTKYEAVSN